MLPVQVQGPEALVPPDLEVAHIPYERGGPYPGVFVFSAPARMIRPVLQMESGARELIGTLEQIDLNIRRASQLPSTYSILPLNCHQRQNRCLG